MVNNKIIIAQNQGITILQIVITVIVMLIILSVSVFYGEGVSKEASLATIYNEIKEVESVLKEAYILNNIKVNNDSITFFDEEEAVKADKSLYNTVIGDAVEDYYYLDFTTSKKLENVLGLENVSHDYLFDLTNLNIFLVEGVELPSGDEINVKYNSDDIVKYYSDTFVK